MTLISGLGPLRLPSPQAAPGRSTGFTVPGTPASTGTVGALSATAGLPGLLALQERDSGLVQDREARRHGEGLLRELAALQRAALAGLEDDAALQRLAGLAGHVPRACDPALDSALRAVTARARAELARRSLRQAGHTGKGF